MISTFFKGMTQGHVTQIFHKGHQALDIVGNKVSFGYGTPLCAPEMCRVLGITKEELSHDNKGLENGYGIRLKGLETGHDYLYWHCLPLFPVYGGDVVKAGQVVAFMGNAGLVYQGGQYVPLDKRNKMPFPGTHLHIQMELNGKRVDPLKHINFSWQPQYSLTELMSATIVVLKKAVTLAK